MSDIPTDELVWNDDDTRRVHCEERLTAAINCANVCEFDKAAEALGEALHPLQDWHAHGNWYIDLSARGTTLDVHPAAYDDPDLDCRHERGISMCKAERGVPKIPTDRQRKAGLRHCFEPGQDRINWCEQQTKEYVRKFREGICKEALEEMFGEVDPERASCCCEGITDEEREKACP